MEIVKLKTKLRNYWWQHPFKSLATVGAIIAITCAFIITVQSLSPLQIACVSGVLLMLIAGLLGLINQ